MKRITILFSILLVGCSSQEQTQSDSLLQRYRHLAIGDTLSGQTSTLRLSSLSTTSPSVLDTAQLRDVGTQSKNNRQVVQFETAEDQTLFIVQRLELARLHYLDALGAQEIGDSSLSVIEFEKALEILDEVSYYPSIDANADFSDLIQSVIEEYEKYIARIGYVDPHASIFALREKLAQDIENSDLSIQKIPREEIIGTAVPLPFNESVERNISFFMGKGRPHFERWLQLSGRFFPMMLRIFREEGVPGELVILSMPESGLRPDARSWAKAVGLWQFMKGTGHLYGLRGNWWYDERRDFEKSTRAAARHMRDLYAEFGDWHLVLAAYNSGAGRVFRAIRRTGSTDYWAMRNHLPRETRNYVPQYIAVARMFRAPERYGFKGILPEDSLRFDIVTIDDCVELRVLAECAQTDIQTLKTLNPELLQWCTPPGVSGYRLRIPYGTSEMFANKYAEVPDEKRRDWALHKISKGETISTIARRYGLSTDILLSLNKIKDVRALSVGQVVTIPLPRDIVAREKIPFDYDREQKSVSFGKSRSLASSSTDSRRVSTTPRGVRAPSGKQRLVYRVKRGDTMGHIAEWYGVRASDIRNWNDIPYGSFIQTNQEVVLWVSPEDASDFKRINEMSFADKQSFVHGGRVSSTAKMMSKSVHHDDEKQGWQQYTVRSGDTLERIAQRYGVTVIDLKTWNGLKSSKILVGQRLDVYGEPEERARVIATPATGSLPTTVMNTRQEIVYHDVKYGETLWQIAKTYKVSVQEIEAANGLNGILKAGDRILIPLQESNE